jgi:hypothetical protein
MSQGTTFMNHELILESRTLKRCDQAERTFMGVLSGWKV